MCGNVHEILDEILNSAHIVLILNNDHNGQCKTAEATPVNEGKESFVRERKN